MPRAKKTAEAVAEVKETAAPVEEKKAAAKKARAPKADAPKIENVAASTTLGDIDVLAQLKAQMEKGE